MPMSGPSAEPSAYRAILMRAGDHLYDGDGGRSAQYCGRCWFRLWVSSPWPWKAYLVAEARARPGNKTRESARGCVARAREAPPGSSRHHAELRGHHVAGRVARGARRVLAAVLRRARVDPRLFVEGAQRSTSRACGGADAVLPARLLGTPSAALARPPENTTSLIASCTSGGARARPATSKDNLIILQEAPVSCVACECVLRKQNAPPHLPCSPQIRWPRRRGASVRRVTALRRMPADGTWLNRLGAKPRAAGRSSAPGPPAASWSSAFAVIETSPPRRRGSSRKARARQSARRRRVRPSCRRASIAWASRRRRPRSGSRASASVPRHARARSLSWQQPSDARVAHVITPALVPELAVIVETLELALFWAIKPPEPPILGLMPRSKAARGGSPWKGPRRRRRRRWRRRRARGIGRRGRGRGGRRFTPRPARSSPRARVVRAGGASALLAADRGACAEREAARSKRAPDDDDECGVRRRCRGETAAATTGAAAAPSFRLVGARVDLGREPRAFRGVAPGGVQSRSVSRVGALHPSRRTASSRGERSGGTIARSVATSSRLDARSAARETQGILRQVASHEDLCARHYHPSPLVRDAPALAALELALAPLQRVFDALAAVEIRVASSHGACASYSAAAAVAEGATSPRRFAGAVQRDAIAGAETRRRRVRVGSVGRRLDEKRGARVVDAEARALARKAGTILRASLGRDLS